MLNDSKKKQLANSEKVRGITIIFLKDMKKITNKIAPEALNNIKQYAKVMMH